MRLVRRGELINVSGTRKGIGRSIKALIETINKNLSTLNLTRHMTLYSYQRRQKIYVTDFK